MTEPYLILHKVRGEPAFDIAIRLLECTEADETKGIVTLDEIWIIPTSGHRAYPSWSVPLSRLGWNNPDVENWTKICDNYVVRDKTVLLMEVANLPDHYACNDSPKPKPVTRVASKTEDFLV